MLMQYTKKFFELEAAGGILLMIMLAIALLMANTPLEHAYHALQNLPVQIRVGQFNLEKPLILWVNEGLMAIFFMLIALEMKREVHDGELSTPSQLILPMAGAIGGIIVPILIYVLFTHGVPGALKGWPIASTTDIAFAMGIVALLGKRVPNSLKVFLITLSIVDDIVVIVIIAIFYTHELSWMSMALSLVGIVGLLLLNRFNVKHIAAYVLVGVFLWVCVLKSGVHATLAGVIVALAIPNKIKDQPDISPVHQTEALLHPWVVFFILPIFVLLNGGIPVLGVGLNQLLSPVSLGVAMGLFVGKTLGVFMTVLLLVKLGFASRPKGASWYDTLGIASLTGIGFTMSLFISALAFEGTSFEFISRQGILIGSLLSILLGCGIFLSKKKHNE